MKGARSVSCLLLVLHLWANLLLLLGSVLSDGLDMNSIVPWQNWRSWQSVRAVVRGWVQLYSSTVSCSIPLLLHSVARGRSLFGDPAAEIQELTQVIKQDISKINTDIAALKEFSKTRTYRESQQVKSHSGAVVVSLQVKNRAHMTDHYVIMM